MAYSSAKKSVPEYQARKGKGDMDEDTLQSIVTSVLEDCRSYVEQELAPARAKATKYYKGEPFGNEEEGRSQVVLTQVRDGVNAVIPSLVRVFHGSERTVEYAPEGPEDTEMAEQATDYAQYIYEQENDGFHQTLKVLKDGLIRKIGILKWGWDKTAEVKIHEFENISRSELELLAADDEVELVKVTEIAAAQPPSDPPQPPPQQPGAPPAPPMPPLPPVPVGDPRAAQQGTEAMYDVTIKVTDKDGKAWVECIPPEEFWFNRDARSIPNALVAAHVSDKTKGELRAMGIKKKDIEEYGKSDDSLVGSPENIARNEMRSVSLNDEKAGEPNEKVRYAEGYFKIDFDGDGIAELRKICAIGPTFHVVTNECWNKRRPFSVFCPSIEPHTLVGTSYADLLMDVQLTQSSILRATLDSLSASIFPRMKYVEGQVSVSDILNNAIGAPIRTRNIQAVEPMVVPFAGREAIPFLDFFNAVVERRTGRNNASAGLKADALQSTSAGAVDAVVTASQEQAELLARTFAETCFKPMFYGLLELMIEHKPRAKMVRLRNKWVSVDPRLWNARMDVKVNVALGTSFIEQKLAALAAIAADQTQIMTQLGATNPLVHISQYRYTRAKYIELQGFPDAAPFYKEVPPDWQPPPPPEPPKSPEQIMAEASVAIEKMKVEANIAIKRAELNWKEEDSLRAHEREMQQMILTADLKRFEINAKMEADAAAREMDAEVKRDVEGAKAEMGLHDQVTRHEHERRGQDHEHQMAEESAENERRGQDHERSMAEESQAHEMKMSERKADSADAAAKAKPKAKK